MKFGIRKANLKNRIKGRTTAKWKRQLKRSVIPFYGKKGTGFIKNPKKAVYNQIYRRTTIKADVVVYNFFKYSFLIAFYILFLPVYIFYLALKYMFKR